MLLAHACLVVLVIILRRFWPELDRVVSGNTLRSFVIGGILMQGLLILLPTVLAILFGKIPAIDLVGTRPRAGSLILAATIGIPAAVVFQGFNNLFLYFLAKSGISLPDPKASAGFAGSDFFQKPWYVVTLVLIISVITPGLIEELMFRGVILSAFRSGGALGSALFWQAAAFAVFHGEPLFLLPPFLAGFMLAAIRRRSESIVPAMLAHMSLNLSMLALGPVLPRLTAQYLNNSSGQSESLLYASLIAACVAAVAFVPLLVLISHLQTTPDDVKRQHHIWPADWKFALAFLMLLVIMVVDPS